jgi:RNA polymerase sigma-70 factor (ECF subfamily)
MNTDTDTQARREHAAARSNELSLARSCLTGDAEALARFEREFGPALHAGARQVCPEPPFVEEVVAGVRGSLFAGPTPKLAAFSGRGPLGAWLRIVAARAALDARRSERRRGQRERAAQLTRESAWAEPERALDRARYRQAFGRAMHSALRALPPRQRALLQLRYRERLELSELSERFAVHRATVQRWLVEATRDLRRLLSSELGRNGERLSASELAGLGPQLTSALGPVVASWLGVGSSNDHPCKKELP